MKICRLLLVLVCLCPALSTFAADPVAAEVTTPATAAEIAYWKKLQAEISAFRAANGAYAASNALQFSTMQVNEIMARIEKFLDARDADPVDSLGADLQAYRKQLMAMLDGALTPLRLVTEGKDMGMGGSRPNPPESMKTLLRANAQLDLVNSFKSELYRLHGAIDKRMGAVGGPRILFFRTLNFGDSPQFEYVDASPAQRDEKFVADSRAIDPALGVLAEKRFLRYRRDGRIVAEIESKRDEFLKSVDEIGKQTANMPNAQLDAQIKGIPADFDAEERALIEFAIALTKLRRSDHIGASVSLQNWKAAFAQWLGKADDLATPDGCNDIALSTKDSRFAYTSDGVTVVVRDLQTGELVFTAKSEHPVRGLTFGADGLLYAFTTGGMVKAQTPASGKEVNFSALNKVPYKPLVGVLSAASERPRFSYAWGAAPAIADGGNESLFRANSSSRITATAMDAQGKRVLFGYSGRNDTGEGKTRHGFDILLLPDSAQELAKLDIKSTSYNPNYSAPVTALALSPATQHVALTCSNEIFGTVEVLDLTSPDPEEHRVQLALDNQSYNFVQFTGEGDALSVVAATRNGVIRVWSLKTNELVARFTVPSGPQGVAVGITGGELVSANLGAPGVYRWSLREGKLLATWDGDAPVVDSEKLAAELKAEQERRAIIPKAMAVFGLKDPTQKKDAAEKLLKSDHAALEASGLKIFLQNAVVSARESELAALNKAQKFPELARLGKQSIADGLTSIDIYYYTLTGAKRTKSPDYAKLHQTALELYPQSSSIRYLHHFYRYQDFSTTGQVDAAMKEVDAIVEIYPDTKADELRVDVLFSAADAAMKANNKQRGLDLYVKSLDYSRTKEAQLNVLPTIFSIAYSLSNWNLAARVAGAILDMDPNKKNDQQFMAAARYAYQQSQGK